MKKSILLFLACFAYISSFALTIPKGKIYYDNSITQFNTVRFSYGPKNSEGTVLVTMTNEGNNIWSYEIPRKVESMYRYIFLETSLADGTYNYDFSSFKTLITDRGEIRTATTDATITANYIFVPEPNQNRNWYQGKWQSKSSFDNGENVNPTPTPDPALPPANCNPNSGKLPVVYLNTDGGKEITSKEEYLKGTIYIDAQGIPGYSNSGSSAAPLVTEVKGRGNYSWTGFNKKPYRIKMDKKASLLNLTTDKSYNLLAHADDTNGFLRNTSGFAISRFFELDYTPTQEPVELFLNGEYKGLYFLVDHIKVSSNRVNITEQDDLETDSDAITGGWLLEIDNYDEDPHITIYKKDYYGSAMWFTYKSPEELSDQQETYIKNFLNLANDAIYSEDKNSTEWEKYIDMDALVNYYLTYEIVANREGFHGSCYLHKDRGANTKLIFGPVWDFGSALMNMNDTFIYDEYAWGVKWIDEIAKFPRFQTAVRERWMEKRGQLMPYLRKEVDAFIDKIAEAAQCDCNKWPSYGNRDVLTKKQEFYNSIERRLAWLDTQFGTVGIEEETIELNVYPNPTTGKIFVNSSEEILSANVYNVAGQKMLELPASATEWDLNLNKGTYLLTIETINNTIVKKIMVK
jgi:hypothetical protein